MVLIGWLFFLAGLFAICVGMWSVFRPLRSLGLTTRKRGGAAIVAGLVLLIVGSIVDPVKPAETGQGAVVPASRVAQDEPVEKSLGRTPTGKPIPSPDAHVMGFCTVKDADVPQCEAMIAEFTNKDWPKAWTGDYQGQRNVSFCMSTGCDGAVTENDVGGCAWRFVILGSGSPQVDSTDMANHETFCGRLSPVALATARAQADETMQAIYGRRLPKGL
jgi:hypothetical protein